MQVIDRYFQVLKLEADPIFEYVDREAGRVKELPQEQIERNYKKAVQDEAAKRLAEHLPLSTLLSLLFKSQELLNNWRLNGSWSIEEQEVMDQIEQIHAWMKDIHQSAKALVSTNPRRDYKDDSHWPSFNLGYIDA
jgi:hypothetical protein